MNKLELPYKNLWDYVEQQSQGRALSKVELQILKADYKKLYNKYLKRRTRYYRRCLHLSLSKQQFEQIQKRATQCEISITDYVRHASVNLNPQVIPQQKLLKLEQTILFLADKVDELSEEFDTTPDSLLEIQDELQNLDSEFQKLMNYDSEE